MIIINDKMFNIIRKESYNNSKYLPKGLNRILRDGVTLHNDCLVLDYFWKANSHLLELEFQDKTQYECFINGFHLNDFCRLNATKYLFVFIKKLISLITINFAYDFTIIITIDHQDVHLTFHAIHQNESEWFELGQIDKSNNAIMVVKFEGKGQIKEIRNSLKNQKTGDSE